MSLVSLSRFCCCWYICWCVGHCSRFQIMIYVKQRLYSYSYFPGQSTHRGRVGEVMEDQITYTFTAEQMQSPYYWLQNKEGDPPRLKFLIFSNTKPATNHRKEFNKRTQKDGPGDANRDVDFLYLKQFIKQFPSKVSITVEDQVKLYQNIREAEIVTKLDKLSTNISLAYYDCFIFIFLTFCSEDGSSQIHFHDKIVPLDKIWEKVNTIEAMKGKPKIFLVQADDLKLMEAMETEEMGTKAGGDSKSSLVPHKIPTDADRLIITSTIPAKGFVARPSDDPSFLIQAFVEAINENKENQSGMDLLTLTVDINSRVAKLIETSKESKTAEELEKRPWDQLQLPCVTSTLRKLLFL